MAHQTLNPSWGRVVGARALKQNASAVLREVAAYGRHVVTVQGEPVATIAPYTPPQQLTVEQFDALLEGTPEDDSRIYELLFGELAVSPSPDFGHQRVALALRDQLIPTAAQSGLTVTLDWSWFIDTHNVPRPDVIVCPPVPDSQTRMTTPPELVVEVTSSNRDDDLARKRVLYAQAGAPAYWVVDRLEVRLVVFTLDPSSMSYPEPAIYTGTHRIPTTFGPVDLDVPRLLKP